MHFKSWGLLNKIRPILGEAFQYHICRPGYGVGWFVANFVAGEADGALIEERWTFFLLGLVDGRQPRHLSKRELVDVLREFIGPDIVFEIITDAPWYWNLFCARRYVYGHAIICGDACHSWPTFGGMGGNTGFGDSTNLAWKLASIIHGWGHRGMLTSYDLERRQFSLKVLIFVLNIAPDSSQLMRLATIAKYPWLWWTVTHRWLFAVRGTHPANQYSSDGLFLGARYRSHIIHSNEEQQGIPALESPPSRYHPSIASGGRLPHIRFLDGSSLNDCIAIDGYTLLVINPHHIRLTSVLSYSMDDKESIGETAVQGDTGTHLMLSYPPS
jgi:hypothetical protein